MNAQTMWKIVYREWRKTHLSAVHARQKRRDSMRSKCYTAALERRISALERQNARLQELLDMANYAVWHERL